MKVITFLASLSFLRIAVSAFPSAAFNPSGEDPAVALEAYSKLSGQIHDLLKQSQQKQNEKRLFFASLNKPIEVTGEHSFVPPDYEAGHQRGPCPGLNALANHGYINRNGITSLVDVTTAINEVYGMGTDLGLILAVMGTVFVGNPLSLEPGFSIGGETGSVSNILNNGLGLLGKPRGLNGSHNLIESDSSNTRNDLYVTGDSSTLVLDQFIEWYNMSTGPVGDYSLDLMADRAQIRFKQSEATNPNFYYGPFTGMIARNAGYVFPRRLFANFSRDHLSGVLTKNIIKSFFAIEGEEGKFTYNKGHERIPENWYRRPVDYGLIQLNLDIIYMVLKHPQLSSIGGNTGKVNTFTGVDLGNVTGGLLNTVTLLKDNNLLCFVFEVLKTLTPNSLSTVFTVMDIPLKLITDTIGASILSLSCPAYKDLLTGGKGFADGLVNLFPGASLSGIL